MELGVDCVDELSLAIWIEFVLVLEDCWKEVFELFLRDTFYLLNLSALLCYHFLDFMGFFLLCLFEIYLMKQLENGSQLLCPFFFIDP